MAAMEAANLHHHHGSHNHNPYPTLPASPTLTNPDMILPDYGRSDSPNPDLDDRDHSPLMMWKNAHDAAAAATGDMHQMLAVTSPNPGNQSLDHPYGPTGPITPTTPIIYGNGTMLSDIGEVTEVESTPGKPSPTRHRIPLGVARRLESPTRGSGSDAALRSSPTMGVATVPQKKSKQSLVGQRARRSSLESNSTITTQDQAAAVFADFDDSVSVGDSVFQGDDEESLASSYVDGTAGLEPPRLGIPSTDNVDRLSTYSTTSLSRRAEEILANAKKRLTTMEGNLSRARTSLHITSPAYGSDASTPSPPPLRASTAMYSRDSGLPSPASQSSGHSRMTSDIAMRNGLPYRVTTPRSRSALGAAGGYRQPLALSKSADYIRGNLEEENSRPTYKVTQAKDTGLQPLNEDEGALLEESGSSTNSAKLSHFLSPTFGAFEGDSSNGSGKGLQRSASASQMRDIKDQMKDLKGKISSLREQARNDSIKRRSLQSLRTPSPFTHSQIDQWYAEPKSNRSSAITTTSGPPSRNPWNGEEESSVDEAGRVKPAGIHDDGVDEHSVFSEQGNVPRSRPAGDPTPERSSSPLLTSDEVTPDDDDGLDLLTENGDEDGEEEEEELPVGFHDAVDMDYESESGDSLYHDTVQHPLSHEDREDAFDYEHFFLHSAMGSMSQRLARRGSTDSYTSEDSTETTRGPVVETQIQVDNGSNVDVRSAFRSRRNSAASVSTVETFATAEEGRSRKSVDVNGEFETATLPMPDDLPNQGSSSPSTSRSESMGNTGRKPSGADARRTDGSSTNPLVAGVKSATAVRDSDASTYSIPEEGSESQYSESVYRTPATRRPISGSAPTSLHRPSVSSFDSTGTNRSFPLVNKPRRPTSTGILTPNSSSPDQELKSLSRTLMNETASVCEQQQQQQYDGLRDESGGQYGLPSETESSEAEGAAPGALRGSNPNAPLALQTLMREDKYLVERLVAGLGRCVLGLTESGRASAESRMYRRRIDAARRILEGLEGGGFE
ncbi:hypothetical protein B0H66DRAFT_61644 [Apodospora peruviana]|uniref:Uncharacterized protein n=1 Tax=Apodospora peruviana TaxID=516989 RepID=A0AAE0MFA0_9PEZI|nr:hypothetical protein B0H66DRAFT_61644 [Apodospora peruviana]